MTANGILRVVTSVGTGLKANRVRRLAGGGIHGQSHGQTPRRKQQFTNDPAHHIRSKTTGRPPVSAIDRGSRCKTSSKALVTETESSATGASTQNSDLRGCNEDH